jgi:hypothetical protein
MAVDLEAFPVSVLGPIVIGFDIVPVTKQIILLERQDH